MKELSIAGKATRYDEALKEAVIAHKDEDRHLKATLERIFPELKESENERIVKFIKNQLFNIKKTITENYELDAKLTNAIDWLERQGEHLENFDEAEKEKSDFVGDGFIKCFANFLDFKEGNTYWLEYMGDDKYNVRSDNLLGKTYHITPCQLYTVFKKLTWLEKHGQQKSANSYCQENCKGFQETGKCFFDWDCKARREAESTNKAEPKFHEDEWIVNNTTKEIFKITELSDFGYESIDENGKTHTLFIDENEYHLWTIEDARDGDVIYSRHNTESFEWIGIFKSLDKENKRAFFYGFWHVMSQSFRVCGNEAYVLYDDFSPATKEQRDLLFQKMHDAGYEWDAEKKELKKESGMYVLRPLL